MAVFRVVRFLGKWLMTRVGKWVERKDEVAQSRSREITSASIIVRAWGFIVLGLRA
jgi:hypothetical protein